MTHEEDERDWEIMAKAQERRDRVKAAQEEENAARALPRGSVRRIALGRLLLQRQIERGNPHHDAIRYVRRDCGFYNFAHFLDNCTAEQADELERILKR